VISLRQHYLDQVIWSLDSSSLSDAKEQLPRYLAQAIFFLKKKSMRIENVTNILFVVIEHEIFALIFN
jgi:hypothetical protein